MKTEKTVVKNRRACGLMVAIGSDRDQGVCEKSVNESTKRKIEPNEAQYENTRVGVNVT